MPSNNQPSFPTPSRLARKTKFIWTEYVQLAHEYKPIDLGIGYADYLIANNFNDVLAEVAANADNSLTQYARALGHPRLVKALAALYGKVIGREIDPFTEVLVTTGALEALFAAIMGNVDDGDEVIIIEPYYSSYKPIVRPVAGEWEDGTVSSGDFVLNDDELRSAFTEQTKMIILNTPNNPLGKIYTRRELRKIADLCHEFNVICVSDEVYQWMTFGEVKHVRICSLPGMWDRTITIGSASKALSLGGWRTGWAYGAASLIHNMFLVHTINVYACVTPVQEALGIVFERELKFLGTPDSFSATISAQLLSKRDFMVKGLRDIGMKVIVPQAGCFMIADWANLESKADLSTETDESKDYRFTKWMAKNVGVMGIPLTGFYNEDHKAAMETSIRFCFFKQEETLEKVMALLRNWIFK